MVDQTEVDENSEILRWEVYVVRNKDIAKIKADLPVAKGITKSYSVCHMDGRKVLLRSNSCYCKKCFIERDFENCDHGDIISEVGTINYPRLKRQK